MIGLDVATSEPEGMRMPITGGRTLWTVDLDILEVDQMTWHSRVAVVPEISVSRITKLRDCAPKGGRWLIPGVVTGDPANDRPPRTASPPVLWSWPCSAAGCLRCRCLFLSLWERPRSPGRLAAKGS